MKRAIIRIDESKCDGCGLCVPQCHEGAIQIVDGKAKLVREAYCDGLGACLGHCPTGAITVEEREAEAFDASVVERKRPATLIQLSSFGSPASLCDAGGCPGSRSMELGPTRAVNAPGSVSSLSHWPIQLHLISPRAPQYRQRDVLLVADCVPFACADFHRRFLDGNAVAIACPKLDGGQEVYVEKLNWLIDEAEIKSLTVVVMEVPCCAGLTRLAQEAMVLASRRLRLKTVVVSVHGEVVEEHWTETP